MNTQASSKTTEQIGLEALPLTSYWTDVMRRFRKNRIAVIGLFIMAAIVILCVGAPLFTDYDPIIDMDFINTLQKPGQNGHALGTDELGRDIWCRLLYGGRNTLVTGVAVTFFSA